MYKRVSQVELETSVRATESNPSSLLQELYLSSGQSLPELSHRHTSLQSSLQACLMHGLWNHICRLISSSIFTSVSCYSWLEPPSRTLDRPWAWFVSFGLLGTVDGDYYFHPGLPTSPTSPAGWHPSWGDHILGCGHPHLPAHSLLWRSPVLIAPWNFFFPMIIVKQRSRLPREVVQPSFSKLFHHRLDGALASLPSPCFEKEVGPHGVPRDQLELSY